VQFKRLHLNEFIIGAGAILPHENGEARFAVKHSRRVVPDIGAVRKARAFAISGKPSAPCGATNTSQRPASMGMKDCEENSCLSMVVEAKGADFGKARVKERLGVAPPRRFSSILSM
jgi:hypothetical protein